LLVRGFFAPEQIVQLLGLDRSELEAAVERSEDTGNFVMSASPSDFA
jgi:hypothetical protein